MNMAHYNSEHEIDAVVQGFENCTTAKEDFTHREHLTVAVCYLYRSDEETALVQMRSGLLRFLDHHHVPPGKYEEGLTVAWIKLIRATMEEFDANLPVLEMTNSVLGRLSDSSLISDKFKGL